MYLHADEQRVIVYTALYSTARRRNCCFHHVLSLWTLSLALSSYRVLHWLRPLATPHTLPSDRQGPSYA